MSFPRFLLLALFFCVSANARNADPVVAQLSYCNEHRAELDIPRGGSYQDCAKCAQTGGTVALIPSGPQGEYELACGCADGSVIQRPADGNYSCADRPANKPEEVVSEPIVLPPAPPVNYPAPIAQPSPIGDPATPVEVPDPRCYRCYYDLNDMQSYLQCLMGLLNPEEDEDGEPIEPDPIHPPEHDFDCPHYEPPAPIDWD